MTSLHRPSFQRNDFSTCYNSDWTENQVSVKSAILLVLDRGNSLYYISSESLFHDLSDYAAKKHL